jgi:CheY-like chemotaxis protein
MADLFEPFNRLGQEQSAIVGSGVGLALSKRLIEAQDGWIRAESRPGVGATFTIGVPMPAGAAAPAEATHDPARPTVLYVEDNPSNVLLMRQIMKCLDGVELLVAANPRDGIKLARAVRPVLILLDINLPDMDGFEVLRFLKTHSKTTDIPVWALTASAMRREVQRGEDAGFDRYITKPFDVPAFVQSLKEVLQRAHQRAELRPAKAEAASESAEDRLQMWAERRPTVRR